MAKRYDTETRRQMILECRQSGMSDQRWCAEHGISTTTFYRWIKLFQEQSCIEIPEKAIMKASTQDVVRLEVLPNEFSLKRDCFTPSTNISEQKQDYFTPTISLERFGTVISLSNQADPKLVVSLLQMMGGSL